MVTYIEKPGDCFFISGSDIDISRNQQCIETQWSEIVIFKIQSPTSLSLLTDVTPKPLSTSGQVFAVKPLWFGKTGFWFPALPLQFRSDTAVSMIYKMLILQYNADRFCPTQHCRSNKIDRIHTCRGRSVVICM